MDRRAFLGANFLLVADGFTRNWGTRGEIKAYRQDRKPLLTERNLNRFFEQASERGDAEKHAAHAATDLAEFLDVNFSLSPPQRKTLDGISPEKRKELAQVLSAVPNRRGRFEFRFVNPPNAECRTEVHVLTEQGKKMVVML